MMTMSRSRSIAGPRLGRRQHHHAAAAARHHRPRRVAVARQEARSEQPTAATPGDTRRPLPPRTRRTATRPRRSSPSTGTPTLEAAATYTPKDNMLQIDISEYAGYGGLIVANGGLEPNPDSFFAKEYGFKVQDLDERERDLVAAQQRPARRHRDHDRRAGRARPAVRRRRAGADRLLARRRHGRRRSRHRLGEPLAGKVLAASQFNESEFFIRYLAQEAGVPVIVLRDLDSRPASSEARPRVLRRRVRRLRRLRSTSSRRAQPRLNGCVGWTPRTDEVVEKSERRSEGAGVEPQPARHRRRARREQGLRQGAPGHGARPGARHSRRQPPAARQARRRTSASSRRRSSGARTRRATSSRTCTSPTCRRTARSSPAPSTPPARSAASSSPRCSPTAA